eukprot:SAG31_NODE_2443_length_5682_cov_3.662428_8_plen_256_part_00
MVGLRVAALLTSLLSTPGRAISQPAVRSTRRPTWRYTGDSRFPALYFAGNGTGFDSEPQLLAESNYSLVILGGTPIGEHGLSGWQQQERVVAAQVLALRQSLEAQRRPPPPICNYLQGALVLPWFTTQRKVLEDPSYGGFIARHPDGSEIVPPLDPALPPSVRGRDRYWDWSNGSAVRDYYVEQVVLPALQASTDCLFFDNVNVSPPGVSDPAKFVDARLLAWQAVGRAMQTQVRSYFLVFVPTIREIRDFYREM